MKNGFWIFIAVFLALGGSWCGFVLAPELQLGGAKQTTVLNTSDVYPVGRPGEATQGSSVYRANGCAACHTEQVRQTGMTCGVTLTEAGKNPQAVTNLISSLVLINLTKDCLLYTSHGVLFPAQIQRTPVAKLLSRPVCILDADSFWDLVRHSTGRAAARVDADAKFRRRHANRCARARHRHHHVENPARPDQRMQHYTGAIILPLRQRSWGRGTGRGGIFIFKFKSPRPQRCV